MNRERIKFIYNDMLGKVRLNRHFDDEITFLPGTAAEYEEALAFVGYCLGFVSDEAAREVYGFGEADKDLLVNTREALYQPPQGRSKKEGGLA